MRKTIDFILLGRITIDFNPTDYYGALNETNNFQKYIGGSTGNTAIGLNRNKQKVVLISKISSDQFGKFILDFCFKENLDTKYIYQDPLLQTGLTFTEMFSKDQSSILMYRTNVADLNLKPDEIDPELIAKAKFLVISGTALASSPSREAALKAVLLAKKYQTKVVFDIDYRAYNWTNLEEVQIYYQMVAKQADLIIGSQEEIALCSAYTDLKLEPFNALKAAKYWLQTCELIIIKNGKKGSELFTQKEHYKVNIVPVEMLKGYGGGDAYASFFLSLYNKKPKDLKTALTYATAAASYMVKSHSSYNHPTYQELTKWMKQNLTPKAIDKLVEVKKWK